MPQSTHENFTREEAPLSGSDRTFGWMMAVALALVSLVNGWHLGRLWPWTLCAAALFLVAAWIRPSSLHPLNRLWSKLADFLHRIVNPIVMVSPLLWRDLADGPRDAAARQGSAALEARAQRGELLDRARAGAPAGNDERAVLIMDFLAELWRFMRVRKKFWLLPVLIMMVVFGGLVVLTEGSAFAPFIYNAVLKQMRILGISAF